MDPRVVERLSPMLSRPWLVGLVLSLAGAGLVAATMTGRLLDSIDGMKQLTVTHNLKLRIASRKGELEQRQRVQQEALAQLEERLVTAADISGLTKKLAVAARSDGCSVLSIRPVEPREVARPDQQKSEKRSNKKKKDKRPPFIERAFKISLRGEYSQISSFLTRLAAERKHLRVARLSLSPLPDNREMLSCALEIATYELGEPGQGDDK